MAPSLRTPTHLKKKQEENGSKKRGRAAPVTDSASKKSKRDDSTRETATSRVLEFDDDEHHEFVPVATNKLIDYHRKGAVPLTPEKAAVLDYVLSVCSLPANFETDHAYGAKSGTTYEDRVISACLHELLQNPDDAFRELFCLVSMLLSRGKRLKKLVISRSHVAASVR